MKRTIVVGLLMKLFALAFSATLYAQCLPIPNGDTRALVWSIFDGKPFAQQTLEDAMPFLNRYGIKLTPPNASGEKTKVGDPLSLRWTRVGFGEGSPRWIPQGDVYAFDPAICATAPAPAPDPVVVPPAPVFDQAAILKAIAELQASEDKAHGELRAAIDAPAWYARLMRLLGTNPIAIALESSLATCLSTQSCPRLAAQKELTGDGHPASARARGTNGAAVKLTELAPRWVRYETRIETWTRVLGDPKTWTSGDPTEEVTGPREITIFAVRDTPDGELRPVTFAEAQGIEFLCPKCFAANGGSEGTHGCDVTFADRGAADSQGSHKKDGEPTRWNVAGDSYDNLTTTPSIEIQGGCSWHGHITNGEIR